MADVVMPQLGETVTEGTVTRWLKQVGEHVDRDEPLFEVSTDKVDSEVPAPAEGTLSEVRVPEGDTVDVGTVLAVISGGAFSAVGPAGETASTSPAEPLPAHTAPSADPASTYAGSSAAADRRSSPGHQPAPNAGQPVANAGQASPAPVPSSGLVRSPVVRHLLAENGIDPAQIDGSGLGGRITRSDVLAVIDSRRSEGAAAPSGPEPQPPGSEAFGETGVWGGLDQALRALPADDEVVPFTNIRRRTAEHMVRSKAISAHTLMAKEADFEAVERVRRAVGERFKQEEGFSLTYLPFVARAVIEALHQWPHLNASVGDDALVVHRRVHLGIAVDLSFEGLVAPVVHGAGDLTVLGLARRIADLAHRARSKQLSPDDVAGGTFTITNPGPFGTFMTVPIINQPQVAILSTDGVSRRPVAVTLEDGSEAVAIRSVGMVALCFDHRAVDGAYAAAFLATMTRLIAERDWAAEL